MFFDEDEKYADNTAFETINRSYTYAEFNRYCRALSSLLGSRSLVFCYCTNSIASMTGYFSCLKSKNVPLLLSAELDADASLKLIKSYKPNYLYGPLKQLLAIRDKLADSQEIKQSRQAASFNTRIKLFTDLLKDAGCTNGVENIEDNYEYALWDLYSQKPVLYKELALLLSTSGSTGSPQLVRLSYENLETNTRQIVSFLEIQNTDKSITSLPMNYTYGMSVINTHYAKGACSVLTDCSLMQKEFWTLMKEHAITSFAGVPYTYTMLQKLRFSRMDLPALRYMTQAGGKLSSELHRDFADICALKNRKFIVMYGQTEATSRMAYLPSEYSTSKVGSIGKAIPEGRFRIMDEHNNFIEEPDTQGELIYYGKNVSLGYARDSSDLALGDVNKGCLHTGDLARKDKEGFFYITGRLKRFVKVFGNRINLDEIDNLLQSEYSSGDFVSVGRDDAITIYTTKKDENFYEKIVSFLNYKTKLNNKVFSVCYISSIPRNSSGKILYELLMK